MSPREESDMQTIVGLALILVLFVGAAVYNYQTYFAPCRVGTVDVSGWTAEGYTRLCAPRGLRPAPE